MDQLEIHRATAADLDAVLDMLKAAGLSLPGVDEHIADFFVARRAGRPVGAMGLELRGTHALLRSAVVVPEERGSGIAARLYATVERFAREQGVHTLVLLTTRAEGYWARHGFVHITRDDVPEPVKRSHEFRGSCPASAAVMSRTLGPVAS